MTKTELLLAKPTDSVSTACLPSHVQNWLFDCEYRNVSDTTIAKYRTMTNNLKWFLEDKKLEVCSKRELQQFILYVRKGHEDPRGRWGNKHNTRPARPSTVGTYFTVLRTFFEYLVTEGIITASPLTAKDRPECRSDQIQPFTQKDVESLLSAAKRSRHPRRDEAIVMLLADTGVRASELCNLTLHDLDQQNRKCRVMGKGRKQRTVYFGKETARALWQYLRETQAEREENGSVFLSDRGTKAGGAMTRSGLLQLIERLGKVAHIDSTRCSPHTFRHTFAVEFLRNGGNVFTLKEILGHTSLTICNRYVALAQADIQKQHQMYSPMDRMRRR